MVALKGPVCRWFGGSALIRGPKVNFGVRGPEVKVESLFMMVALKGPGCSWLGGSGPKVNDGSLHLMVALKGPVCREFRGVRGYYQA